MSEFNGDKTARRLIRTGTVVLFMVILVLGFLLAEPKNNGLLFARFSFKASLLLGGLLYLFCWGVYASLSVYSTRSILARFLLTSCSLIAIFGVFELATVLRIIDYRNVFVSPAYGINVFDPFHDPTWRVDPELIHIRRPNAQFDGDTTGNLADGLPNATTYPVHAVYDANGFRNDQTATQARIIVVGDSFVEAGLSPTKEMTSNQLAELAESTVVNLGQCAYGPQQELIVLRRFGLPLRPEIVIWCFFGGNDLPNVSDYERKIKNLGAAMKAHDGFVQRSLTMNVYQMIVNLTTPLFNPPVVTPVCTPGSVTLNGSPLTMYFYYAEAALTAKDEQNLATAKSVLATAHDETTRSGAKFLLAYIPTKFAVYDEFCEFPADSEAASWSANDLPDRLGTWCAEQGIDYLNLTEPLKAAARKGKLVYLTDDTHWSAEGNVVAAVALAETLREKGWLGGEMASEMGAQ